MAIAIDVPIAGASDTTAAAFPCVSRSSTSIEREEGFNCVRDDEFGPIAVSYELRGRERGGAQQEGEGETGIPAHTPARKKQKRDRRQGKEEGWNAVMSQMQ